MTMQVIFVKRICGQKLE